MFKIKYFLLQCSSYKNADIEFTARGALINPALETTFEALFLKFRILSGF